MPLEPNPLLVGFAVLVVMAIVRLTRLVRD